MKKIWSSSSGHGINIYTYGDDPVICGLLMIVDASSNVVMQATSLYAPDGVGWFV